ncbi:TetR/AcrR family transcriptional regulator [Microbacterium foliorum]|uniref:Bacterial regulatory protein, tetR family n=1 Tax=Microbacterium foliorum TaxID=104336 RepID=A0A0F0L2F0_9MICO|nr:TetR/AcrR family transcriptional regulator [Microbacterium foliorum]AXL10856.1 TetR/AcrR family transcriptional regulator [Microbacterium foliorum]KJL27317.1 Bacterial regulatory protein, tetR family [Microbacterium foliorum]
MARRGQYAKGAAKRAEILAVALDVVAELGTRKASNREIAARVGLTQPGLMHYFSTREELFLEVLRARDERDHERFHSPQRGFQSFLDVIAHNASVPGLVRLYVEYSAEATLEGHPARAFFEERFVWVRALMTEAVRHDQAVELMGPDVDIPYVVDLVIAAADGLQVQWLLDPSIDMADRLARLWQGVRETSWPAVAT